MAEFRITNDGDDYGTWTGETAAHALLACLADADHTREWRVEHLSDNAGYGKGASTSTTWGNGAQDRSRFWYVATDSVTRVFVASTAEVA